MAKLAVSAAVFAALIALSTAFTTTTTVVTTEVNPRQQQQPCEREVQQMSFTHCKQYVQSGAGRRQYDDLFLRSAVANPQRYEEEHLEECCEEMRNVSKDCRGDAMRKLIVEIKERFGSEEMEKQEQMRDRVRGLTQRCNLKSSPYMV